MTEPIDKYQSQPIISASRRQAWKVWTVGLAIVFVWAALIIGAPVAKAGGAMSVASPVYSFFSYICHQIPTRSFYITGEPFAVCTRCFGVYFGLVLGFAAYPFWRNIDSMEPPPRVWLFISLIPIAIDWSLTVFGIWENTQLSRFVTGLILGFACATFIVPAIVEIRRNLFSRKRARYG